MVLWSLTGSLMGDGLAAAGSSGSGEVSVLGGSDQMYQTRRQ